MSPLAGVISARCRIPNFSIPNFSSSKRSESTRASKPPTTLRHHLLLILSYRARRCPTNQAKPLTLACYFGPGGTTLANATTPKPNSSEAALTREASQPAHPPTKHRSGEMYSSTLLESRPDRLLRRKKPEGGYVWINSVGVIAIVEARVGW